MAAISCTLLVDDDEISNFLNQRLLHRLAVSNAVLVARNGQQALELLRTHFEQPTSPAGPTLILLDMQMALMNDFEFLEFYTQRSTVEKFAVVVVMLTTSPTLHGKAKLQRLPIAGVLTKPLTQAKIQQILQHFGQAVGE